MKQKVGLKSSWQQSQLIHRLALSPTIIEIFLNDRDLEEHYSEIGKTLDLIHSQGIETIVHQPNLYNDLPVGLAYESRLLTDNSILCWTKLRDLCQEYNSNRFVGHPFLFLPHSTDIDCKERLLRNLLRVENLYPFLYLENDGEEHFSKPEEITWILQRTDADLKLCLDIAHLFMAVRDNQLMLDWVKHFSDRIGYLHISDSDGYKDGLIIGEGQIEFLLLNEVSQCNGVLEIQNIDEDDPIAMRISWTRWNEGRYLHDSKQKKTSKGFPTA